MGGLLGGGGSSGIDERIADILVEVFDRYDVEPGELNENINDTIELVKEFAPVVKKVEDVVDNMENDVNDVRDDIQDMDENMEDLQEALREFNDTSGSLAVEMRKVNESMEQFNKMVAEAAEKNNKED